LLSRKRVESDGPKILFGEWGVKEEIASPAGIDDFGSNYCILKENPKSAT